MHAGSSCSLARPAVFEQQLVQMCIRLVRWPGPKSLKGTLCSPPWRLENIPLSVFSLCNYSLVASCHYLSSRSSFICSLICAASSLCQLRQDGGQPHKHSTDKDGQLFTDKAKVLLAPATTWACACVRVHEALCPCVWLRKGERRKGEDDEESP